MTISIAEVHGYVLQPEPRKVSVAEVHGYVLSKTPSPAAVRQIAGYAVNTLANPLLSRQIAGYALTNDGNPVVGKNGRDAIFDAILHQSKITRPKTHFTLGQPEAFTYEDGPRSFNARIKLTANVVAKLKGEMWFYYNRTSIARMLRDPNIVRVIGVATTHELIPVINAATGFVITTDDIVNEPIPANSDWFEVTAAATSHMFIAGTKGVVGQKPIVAEPWLVFDPVTQKEMQGRNVSLAVTGATLDNSLLIDGEPSLRITDAGRVQIDLTNDIFDSSIAEWTLEWSSRTNRVGVAGDSFILLGGTNWTFTQRVGTAARHSRIEQAWRNVNDADFYSLPYTPNQKLGVLTRYAAVKKNGAITMFVDGVPFMLANSTSISYASKAMPAGPGDNCFLMRIGFLDQNIGAIRLTKKALYAVEYIPRPIKPVVVPSFNSFIPVGKLDGFQPQG